jgi:ribulose-5-phosphate 4-epimerase/fuculose-1-phosphate aldolase
MIQHEGIIKFKTHWNKEKLTVDHELFEALNICRNKLKAHHLIGVYDNGIGYGNISCRINSENKFLITGSSTGDILQTSLNHYAIVSKYNIETNEVWCEGETKASSESLTHAAIYESDPEINFVIHIHNKKIWSQWMHKLPTTDINIDYGTPEMAKEIRKCIQDYTHQAVIIMGGHEEGIITYGMTSEQAMNNLRFISSDINL